MKHQDIVSKMTLEEKAAFLGGHGQWDSWELPRVGIPAMFMSDGPHGLRRQPGTGDHLGLNESLPATCFPTAATMANSWDPALGEEVGEALGEEAMVQDAHVLLGPGLNIKRSPLCGRNFEYFSEDPYLAGKMAASYVRGIQSKGVCSCIKHFAVNSQEERRMAMNAVVDERTLREIYLTGFEIAVKEGGARAIMSSYNQVNGVYANESKHLLDEILRKDWGFDGIVITDWGASNDHVEGVKAGSNLEMPGAGLGSARELVEAVQQGKLEEKVLDQRVDELLDVVLTYTEAAKGHAKEFDKDAHHRLAQRAAAESAVLLKNEDGILPLAKGTKVAVIGDFAFAPRYQGAGSSEVNTTKLDTIEALIGEEADLSVVGMSRGYKRDGEEDMQLQSEALELAKKADVVLYFFGLSERFESEGMDRKHLRIPANQIQLLEALAAENDKVVGVLSAGAVIEMPWDDKCKGLLHSYLAGQAGAGAMLDILTGRVNPSGKLAETYPIRLKSTPAYNYYPAQHRNSDYREAIYVGYRYYDTARIKVKYPFGFGLSYTNFEYSDLVIDETGVTCKIRNAGDRDGAEIAQMYVSAMGNAIFRPKKELKGFQKVFLKAGEEKEVHFPFDAYTFRYWNRKTDQWEVEGGTYRIRVGGSSKKFPLKGVINVEGTGAPVPYDKTRIGVYWSAEIKDVGDDPFADLLGYAVPNGKWSPDLEENDALCQMKGAKSGFARMLVKRMEKKMKKADASGKPDMDAMFVYNMPFRALAKLSAGKWDMAMARSAVKIANGHFWSGLGGVVSGYFKNSKANKQYEKKLKGGA